MTIIIADIHIFAYNNRRYEHKETNYFSKAPGASCCDG